MTNNLNKKLRRIILVSLIVSACLGVYLYVHDRNSSLDNIKEEVGSGTSTNEFTGRDSSGTGSGSIASKSDISISTDKFLTGKVNNPNDDERLDKYNSEYPLVSLDSDKIYLQLVRDKEIKAKRKKMRLDEPLVALKFNSCYSSKFKKINKSLYQIVQRYFCSDNFSDTDFKQYVDPLYIMAVSNVELGGYTSPDVLLAPAIPTSKGINVTEDNILTFGYSDYLQYPNILSQDRDEYRGPLQMYVTGMTQAIKPDELLSCEWVQLQNSPSSVERDKELSSPQYVEGSGTVAHVDGMVLSNKAGAYGDRWNYGDAVNRLSGTIKNNWLRYTKNSKASKVDNYAIDNKYSWMAMTAIGHNASPGIFYMGDNINIGKSYFWWPFGPYSNAREYCHFLGDDSVTTYIADMADSAVSKHRAGGKLAFRLTRQQGMKIARKFIEDGVIPNGLFKDTCWNNEEKIAYPIQVLYNYFILKAIYSGK